MRLLTRADFDGLACAVLLKEFGIIDNWKFVHPKDMQDELVQVTDDDVLANVPYVPGCKMWFDHHSSERERLEEEDIVFEGESRITDSAARVIYEYYDGPNKLPHLETMVIAVDKVDSAKLTKEEILNPEGWVLLGFLTDPRTGLGRFRDFRLQNFEFIGELIDICAKQPIEEIMENPDVVERKELYFEQNALFKEMIQAHTKTDENVIITDLREVEPIYTGNRFLVYSLFPEQNVSLWIVDGFKKQNAPISCGYSILNRTCKTDVGALMLKHGGGGHKQVGTCQITYSNVDEVLAEIVEKLKADDKA
jgi:nanoRNase/pAp phosphatase (c-di-AMP/oligoRNAs hydrolase)